MASFTFSAPANGANPAFSFSVTGVLTTITQPDGVAQAQTISAYYLTSASGKINGHDVTLFTQVSSSLYDSKNTSDPSFTYNNAIKLSSTGDFGTSTKDGVDRYGIALTDGTNVYRFYYNGQFFLDNETTNTSSNYATSAVTSDAPCYVAGTRLLTPRGEVAVEDLVVGDEVVIMSGERRAIRWIGRRAVEMDRHERPQSVWPVRIAAGALGEGAPRRDLLVSPEHALWLDGGLAPALSLVNGATIRQEAWARVTYFHVELDSHEMLIAEGTPAESYLDCDNRRGFDNAPVTDLRPDWLARSRSRPFLPAARLAALRETFALRARALGRGAECDAYAAGMAAKAHAPRTNVVRNPRAEGHPPRFWQVHAPQGVRATWAGAGEEAGLPYVDLRVFGRAAQAGAVGVYPEPGRAGSAQPGENWSFSCWLGRAAGDLSGVAGANLYFDELDAQGRYLGGRGYAHALPEPDSLCRVEATHRMRSSEVAAMTAYIQLNLMADVEVDVTLRVAGPQIERGEYASALILPPTGELRAASRQAPPCARVA